MATSPVPALVTALKALLAATAPISTSSIPVALTEPADDDKQGEHVWFGDVETDHEYLAHGPSYLETGTLTVNIRVRQPGSGDAVQDAARDRAIAIWEALATTLLSDPTVSGTVKEAHCAGYQTATNTEPGRTVVGLAAGVAYKSPLT